MRCRLRLGCGGATLGGLYFANSIESAGGAPLATFVLLLAIGLPGAMRFQCCRQRPRRIVRLPDITFDTRAASAKSQQISVEGARPFAAVHSRRDPSVYEIGWVRMLSLVFGSTVHRVRAELAKVHRRPSFGGGLWIRRRIDVRPTTARRVADSGWVRSPASLDPVRPRFDWVVWFSTLVTLLRQRLRPLANAVTGAVSVPLMAPAAFLPERHCQAVCHAGPTRAGGGGCQYASSRQHHCANSRSVSPPPRARTDRSHDGSRRRGRPVLGPITRRRTTTVRGATVRILAQSVTQQPHPKSTPPRPNLDQQQQTGGVYRNAPRACLETDKGRLPSRW